MENRTEYYTDSEGRMRRKKTETIEAQRGRKSEKQAQRVPMESRADIHTEDEKREDRDA